MFSLTQQSFESIFKLQWRNMDKTIFMCTHKRLKSYLNVQNSSYQLRANKIDKYNIYDTVQFILIIRLW